MVVILNIQNVFVAIQTLKKYSRSQKLPLIMFMCKSICKVYHHSKTQCIDKASVCIAIRYCFNDFVVYPSNIIRTDSVFLKYIQV